MRLYLSLLLHSLATNTARSLQFRHKLSWHSATRTPGKGIPFLGPGNTCCLRPLRVGLDLSIYYLTMQQYSLNVTDCQVAHIVIDYLSLNGNLISSTSMLYMSLQHTTSLLWLDICYVTSKQVATAGLAPASLRQLIWTRLGAA